MRPTPLTSALALIALLGLAACTDASSDPLAAQDTQAPTEDTATGGDTGPADGVDVPDAGPADGLDVPVPPDVPADDVPPVPDVPLEDVPPVPDVPLDDAPPVPDVPTEDVPPVPDVASDDVSDDLGPSDDVPVVDPCADGGGCGEHATCSADGPFAKCTCVAGWLGDGVSCAFDGVIVEDIDTYVSGGFTTELPADPSQYQSMRIVASANGVPTTFTSPPPVAGVYYFAGVPEGPYALERFRFPNPSVVGATGPVYVFVSSQRTLRVGLEYSFRAGTSDLTQPSTITVSGALTQPWEVPTKLPDGTVTTLNDQLRVYSREVFNYSALASKAGGDGATQGPLRGDTAVTGWVVDVTATAQEGDSLLIAHARHSRPPTAVAPPVGFDEGYALVSWLPVPNATLENGGNLDIAGAFQTAPPQSLSLAYDGDAFNALVAPFADRVTVGDVNVYLEVEASTPQPKIGHHVPLVELFASRQATWADPVCNGAADPCDPVLCPSGCSTKKVLTYPGSLSVTLDYRNPFDYGQMIAGAALRFFSAVTQQLPEGESYDRLRGRLATSDNPEKLPSGTLAPQIGLPSDIRVAGKLASLDTATVGVGLTPEISWAAPTLGTPTSYNVQLFELTDLPTVTGGIDARRRVLGSTTEGTTLRVPPGVLTPGRHYYAEVWANQEFGYDPARPFAQYRGSSATMPSGVFAPCGCHKEALCTTDPAGAEVCTCKPGWGGDGLTCAPLPCTFDNGGCAADAVCSNDGAVAKCTCPEGLIHTSSAECVTAGERCDAPFVLETTASGTTDGWTDDHYLDDGNPCIGFSMGANAPDAVYEFTAPSSGDWTFTLDAAHDAVLAVRPDCTTGCYGADLERDADGKFRVSVSLVEGQTVLVVVDGYANDLTPFAGPYTLDVSATPPG